MINKLFLSSNRKRKNDDNTKNNGQPDWMRIMVIGFLIYAGIKVYMQKDDVPVGQSGDLSDRKSVV